MKTMRSGLTVNRGREQPEQTSGYSGVVGADRNLNPHKGIHTPHARYDFVPDPIRPVVGMQELSWISTELFGVPSGLSHSV